jgi:pimeloyl-ACP methyl ester carboxylesterase
MGRLSALVCAAFLAVAASLYALANATKGLAVAVHSVGAIPATVYKKPGDEKRPVVILAHGFAGSQQFMQPIAVTLAQNGFIAVTFDFAGHGRNAEPLHGGLGDLERSTQTLLAQLDQMTAFAAALPQADGRLGAVGHSMSADLVVRYAAAHPEIGAVVALSYFGTEATPERPKNLLVIDGAWESDWLKRAGYRVVAAAAGGAERERVTYGDFAQGSARRFVLAPSVEHIGVLYSADALQETLAWMNGAFGRNESGFIDRRGRWLLLLLLGLVVLARPASMLLPVLAPAPMGAGLSWRRLWPLCVAPAALTPLLTWMLPTRFLPMPVADYLVAHFAVYACLTCAGLLWLKARAAPRGALCNGAFIAAAAGCAAYYVFAMGAPIDLYVTAVAPTFGRLPFLAILFPAIAAYCVADAWATRGVAGAYLFSRFCFAVSLGIAIALEPRRLFFLIVITPVMLLLFAIFWRVGAMAYRRLNDPRAGALGEALALAIAISAVFPMVD